MLDASDRKIVDLLIAEPRATHRKLAQALQISESTVASRIRHLVEADAIASTIAFDWRAAGFRRSVYFWLRCRHRSLDAAAADLEQLPFTRNISSVLGSANLFVHLLLAGGDNALIEARGEIGAIEGVTIARQDIVLEHFAHTTNVAALPIIEPAVPDLPDPVVPLDELDMAMCAELAADARASYRSVARAVGTTEATLRTRLKRLESAGLMRIVTVVDGRQIPAQTAAAFVGIRGLPDPRSVAAHIAALPYVTSATTTSGQFDIHLIAGAASTAELTERLERDLPALEPGALDVHLVGWPYVFSARLRRLL